MTLRIFCFAFSCFIASTITSQAIGQSVDVQTNDYAYLDEFLNPYYPHAVFPKLTTPQWIGEPDVDAVVTLGIDDMRDTAKYESYLRPILNRLKAIDGRAAVSIMTCKIDPNDPQLQEWLDEGVSLETHTVAHPCPCLQGGDFAKAKATYDDCVDMMFAVDRNHPVAFRFPCMDSKNTPSPRAFAEIINKTTDKGNFLQASTSVVCVLNSKDDQLPKELTLNEDGSERFERYIPFPSFVNKIENYPYPFVIGKLCWEFPCSIPDDWQAQNIQQPNNPRTVDDIVAVIEATRIKQGIANIIFHPHNWIRNDQMVQVVDRVARKHGSRVKFLTFRECMNRINKNLLLGQPIRDELGRDNGVRILDLNRDGFMDVMIGNDQMKIARIWQPKTNSWKEIEHDIQFVSNHATHLRVDRGVRIGQAADNAPVFVANTNEIKRSTIFDNNRFVDTGLLRGHPKTESVVNRIDNGLRLRDLDLDGRSEILIGNAFEQNVYKMVDSSWKVVGDLPAPIVDEHGRDNGVRFIDLDGDGYDDFIVSNPNQQAVFLYDRYVGGFTRRTDPARDIPLIVRDGTNNGVWFAANHMWVQNEDTTRLPDGVDRRSFEELVRSADPPQLSPKQALKSIQTSGNYMVELVASEPMVKDPVAIDWGFDGKLWVVEMADYPLGMDDKGKPGGRVRYLEDTNYDGKYDKSTLFLDNIAYPTGVIAWRDGVIISAAPTIFFAADRDQDGKADYREDLYRGFGEGNQQHLVNGFERGLDNWLYLANGDSNGVIESVKTGATVDIRGQDLRIRPSDGALQTQAGRTQFGRHRDDHGNWFGCSNPLPLRHYVLADHYIRRNPHFAPPSLRHDVATVSNTQLFPISKVLSHWSGYKPPAPGTGHKFTSACSTMVYRDNLFGPNFENNTFTCEPVHNAVHRRRLIPNGLTFKSERAGEEQNCEFLASADSWFRPTTVTTGPDGAIWVVDMYRLVIEHPEWIDDDREKALFLRAGHDRGRIYRVYPRDAELRKIPRIQDEPVSRWATHLLSPNGRVRDMAQAFIIQENAVSRVRSLTAVLRGHGAEMHQLHALCTLDGLGELDLKHLLIALENKHPTVRRHAIRISEKVLRQNNDESARVLSVLDQCDRDDTHVKLQLAYSLGESSNQQATLLLAKLAIETHDNPYLRAAIISSLSKKNLQTFWEAISHSEVTVSAYQDAIVRVLGRIKSRSLFSRALGQRLELVQQSDELDASQLQAITAFVRTARTNQIKIGDSVQDALHQLAESAMGIAMNDDNPPTKRSTAIEFAGEVSPASAKLLIELFDISQPAEVQVAAAKASLRKSRDKVLNKLDVASPSVRNPIISEMIRWEWTALRLLHAINAEVVSQNSIGLSHRQALLSHPSKEVIALASDLFGKSSADKSEVMKQYADVSPVKGNVVQGEAIFKKNCSACHKVKGIGNVVGPDLAAIKNRSTKAMLTAILNPNAAVEDKYRAYSVLTTDGDAYNGMIAAESGNSLTLRMQGNQGDTTVTILREDIERIKSTGLSFMPEELEKVVSPSEMNHLLAFLNELGPAPRQFDGNVPSIVEPKEDGTIELLATSCRIFGSTIVYEPKYKNIGFWSNPDDFVEWTFNVDQPGTYSVSLNYACPKHTAGNPFRFTCGRQTLTGKIKGTRTWDDYQRVELGTIELTDETMIGSFRANGGIRKNLLDLRSLTLTLVKN